MKLIEIISEKKTLKNSNPCWKGYHPVGTKKKGGRTVPNCVPNESVKEAGSPAQQAAIAINMKKNHQKPKSEAVGDCEGVERITPDLAKDIISKATDKNVTDLISRSMNWGDGASRELKDMYHQIADDNNLDLGKDACKVN